MEFKINLKEKREKGAVFASSLFFTSSKAHEAINSW